MANYQEGKIYMVWFEGEDKRYYGSSISTLTKRLSQHKSTYKGKGTRCALHDLFDKYGVDKAKIELVEAYPCNNRSELQAREGFHIRNNEHVNRNVTGRSVEEKKEIKKTQRGTIEHQRELRRVYRVKNRERIREQQNQRYLEKKTM